MNTTLQAGLTPASLSSVLEDSGRVPRMLFGFSNPNASSGISGGNGIMFAWAAQINYHAVPYYGGPQNNSNLGYTLTLLWNKTIPPPNPTGTLTYSLGPVNYDMGIFTVFAKETMQWYGYSLRDGSLVWGPTASQGPWDMYGAGGVYAFGCLFSSGYGGVLYCYNMTTGKLLWTYTAKGVGFESPYGNYDLSFQGSYYADGKIYLGSSEHSPTKPLWRGSYLRCVDAATGQEIWKIQDWYESCAIQRIPRFRQPIRQQSLLLRQRSKCHNNQRDPRFRKRSHSTRHRNRSKPRYAQFRNHNKGHTSHFRR